jgi:hypothetical protein
MPDKILDRLQSAVAANNVARVMSLMPELMDAIGKTIFETPCKRNDRVYLIKDYWSEKEHKYIKKVCTTHFISYLIYPESPVRILYNITADSSWHEIGNLYFDLKTAHDALERGKGNE